MQNIINENEWKKQWDTNYSVGYSADTKKATAKDILMNNPNYSRVIFGKPVFETYLYPNWRNLEKIDNVLEIGCGDGWNAIQTFNKVDRYVGTDISTVAINEAKNRFLNDNYNVKFIDTTDIISLNECFDLIFSITVFQHIPREVTAKYISDSYQILKSGGCLFFNVLSGELHNNVNCILVESKTVYAPNLGFDINSIIKLCKDANFTDIKFVRQEVGFDSEGPVKPNLPYWWYWLICKK